MGTSVSLAVALCVCVCVPPWCHLRRGRRGGDTTKNTGRGQHVAPPRNSAGGSRCRRPPGRCSCQGWGWGWRQFSGHPVGPTVPWRGGGGRAPHPGATAVPLGQVVSHGPARPRVLATALSHQPVGPAAAAAVVAQEPQRRRAGRGGRDPQGVLSQSPPGLRATGSRGLGGSRGSLKDLEGL